MSELYITLFLLFFIISANILNLIVYALHLGNCFSYKHVLFLLVYNAMLEFASLLEIN